MSNDPGAGTPAGTRLLDRTTVRSLLHWPEVIEALRESYRAAADQAVLRSEASQLQLPAGLVHLKAGGLLDPTLVSIKANLRPEGAPASGVILLFDADRGALTAVLDSADLTAYRTAAAAVVAAKALGAPDGCSVAVLGAGPVGACVLQAMVHEVKVSEFQLWGRNETRAADVAAATAADVAVHVHRTPGAAAASADVVVTCTPSREPLIGAADLRTGALVLAMGADSPGKRELAADVIDGAVIVVDSAAARSVGESAYLPELADDAVLGEIGELLTGRISTAEFPGRRKVFDSVGIAHVDTAVAAAVVRQAEAKALGEITRLDA
jgi:ornithine cyclodeaminase/alanine dehydrogenase-like protein (mu-crystallin family)